MSFDQPIGDPFTLASLSKPVSSTHGRVHAAGVCSFSGIKKRKRTEIAVGLDGEGVSIYSVCLIDSIPDDILLILPKAPKPPTRHIICAAAERILHDRPTFDLSQGHFKDSNTALHLCLPSWLNVCG